MAVEVYERIRPNGEVWYGVKANGKDLNAEWADPDAARRRAEEYLREVRGGGRAIVETSETETPAEPELEPTEPEAPEAPAEPETEETTEETTEDAPAEDSATPSRWPSSERERAE